MAEIAPQWRSTIPSNINPLSPTGFKFTLNKLPKLQFYCQTVNLPGMLLGEPEFGTPFTRIPIPGETITFDQLEIQFLVDETMENFKTIHNWIMGLGFPQDYGQYTDFLNSDQVSPGKNSELTKNYSDATLFILTNNNTESKIISFKNVFPVALNSLTFTAVDSDIQYLVGNASFKYSYYEFEN